MLAAIVYVNNTDLLHWPSLAYTSPGDLIEFVQKEITDWGLLSQASGGILKPSKCLVYFLNYKFVGGQAKIKSIQDLLEPMAFITEGDRTLPLHITITQPDRSLVPIVTHDVTTPSKVLGVNFTPAGNCLIHVEQVVQKGLDLVECLRTKPVPRRNAWLSFYLQLLPAIVWGLVTVCLHPKKLDAMIQRVYKKALPSLGVNRKIKKEWRTLPEMYQGLAPLNFPLLALSKKVLFLLGNWGFFGQAHSYTLAMAYENFLVEVGLYKTPLQWSYLDYGQLSTEATWFQNLWLLAFTFGASIIINKDDQACGICENNRSLMSELYRIRYHSRSLVALNIVRRFRNLFHVSDIIKCDGHTTDEFIVSSSAETSTSLGFPCEEPTNVDFWLWKEAIH